MKAIRQTDVYQVRSSAMIQPCDYKVMTQLYQPLIGLEATMLYLTLYSELDQIRLTKTPALMSRLLKITGLSVKGMQDAFNKLEALGLVKTYMKDSEERYLFDLSLPLSPKEFIQHRILNTLLKEYLQQDYDKTVVGFQVYNVNIDEYTDVSSRFKDVFNINIENNHVNLHTYQNKEKNHFEDEYDMELFYNGLEHKQISSKMLNLEDEKLIKQLGILYKINPLDMQNIVKKSMFNYQLDHESFKKGCREYYDVEMPQKYQEIFNHQPVIHQSLDSNKDKHIHYLENISPYELLKDKQGGKEPLRRDLQTVESIMTKIDIPAGVMNVLIELTLEKCNQLLPKNFMEMLAGQWKRKNIQTVPDAIKEGKEYLKYQGKVDIKDVSDITFTQYQYNDHEENEEEFEFDEETLRKMEKYK